MRLTLFFILFWCTIQNSIAQRKKNIDFLDTIYKMHAASDMDVFYKSKIRNVGHTITIELLDDIRAHIARQAVWDKNTNLAEEYISLVKAPVLKSNKYFGLARVFVQHGNLILAEKYAHLAVDSIVPYLDRKDLPYSEDGLQPQSILAYSTLLLVDIQQKLGKSEEAIVVLTGIIPKLQQKNGDGLLQKKGDLYVHLKQENSAMKVFVELFMRGNESEALINKMRRSFLAIHKNSESDFNIYMDSLKNKKFDLFRDHFNPYVNRQLAPEFSLKDLDGNTVTRKSLSGKIVIIDFWAMWCGPCKASFPAMQKIIAKYKNRDDVKFLFIDTWESMPLDTRTIENYLKQNEYEFHVLRDVPDGVAKEFKVAADYSVKSLPEKVVIDQYGYIVSRINGYNGNLESTIKELSFLIDSLSQKER